MNIKQLDIREYQCPITFVKTRVVLDSIAPGERMEVLCRGEEVLESLPKALSQLGHRVVEITALEREGDRCLLVEKKG